STNPSTMAPISSCRFPVIRENSDARSMPPDSVKIRAGSESNAEADIDHGIPPRVLDAALELFRFPGRVLLHPVANRGSSDRCAAECSHLYAWSASVDDSGIHE